MEYFTYRDQQLHCEDVLLQEVAEQFGTPLYVYSKNRIVENFRRIDHALEGVEHLTCYALKANSNLHILKLLAQEGAGADVVSGGELFLALKAGFPPEKVTYTGVGKREEEIEFALKKKISSLTLESEEELDVVSEIAARLNVPARVLIRLNPDVGAESHPYISTGQKVNKFGIDLDKALNVVKSASRLPNVEVIGVHTHIGSQITKVEPFTMAAHALVQFMKQLCDDGVQIRQIDFGGGMGVSYRNVLKHESLPVEANDESVLSVEEFIKAVLPILQPTGCSLVVEPGRSVVADTGVLLTKVLYTKETGKKKFVIVDAGMNDLIRPSLYQAYHQIVPLQLADRELEAVDVVGPICESADFFATDRKLQKLHRGDYLAITAVGAYGFSESSNYNARPRAAEILVNSERCRVIRERETWEDLL